MRPTARSTLAIGSWALATGALALALGSAGAAPAAPRPAAAAQAKRPSRAELLTGFDPGRRSLTSLARGPAELARPGARFDGQVEAGLAPSAARGAAEQRFVSPLAHGKRAVLT